MMKARADDRRIFDSEVQAERPGAIQDSKGMDAEDITRRPQRRRSSRRRRRRASICSRRSRTRNRHSFSTKATGREGPRLPGRHRMPCWTLFENAKTFGSLIQVPPKLAAKLPEIEKRLDDVLKHGDLIARRRPRSHAGDRAGRAAGRQYDCVVANPPYMGSKYYNAPLKAFVNDRLSRTPRPTCTHASSSGTSPSPSRTASWG